MLANALMIMTSLAISVLVFVVMVTGAVGLLGDGGQVIQVSVQASVLYGALAGFVAWVILFAVLMDG